MRTLIHSSSPHLAALALAALLVVMLFAGPLLREVRAQETAPAVGTATPAPVTATTQVPVSVAVVDFQNRTDYPAPGVGRNAADAMALALNQTQRYDAIGRTLVDTALQDLRLTPPLSNVAASLLGKELQVAGVVTGEIRQIRILQSREGRRAEVVLAVLLIDVQAQAPINGALVRVSGTPKPGFSGDDQVLVNEAINLAAFQATQRLLSNNIGVATVLTVFNNSVQLNGGTNDGYLAGMTLVVMRYGTNVGTVRLTEVRNTSSTGTITENHGGVATGDKAFPVFTLPSGMDTAKSFETVVKKSERRSKLSSALLGALALGGLVALVGGRSSGTKPVTGVVSSSLADAITELTQINLDQSQLSGGTLTTWPGGSNEQDVLAWLIYRNGQLVWVQFPELGRFYVDPLRSSPVPVVDPVAGVSLMAEFTIDETTGALTTRDLEEATTTTPEGGPGTNSWTLIWRYTLPVNGISYTYRVTKLVRYRTFEHTGTETGTGGTTAAAPRRVGQAAIWALEETPVGEVGGPATMVTPPLLADPINGAIVTNPNAVLFSWVAAAGADQYVLQISRTSDFTPANTQEYTLSGSAIPPATLAMTVDVAAAFPSSTPQTLYWRVGAKNRADPVPPRQVPGKAAVRPQDSGWVWGGVQQGTDSFVSQPWSSFTLGATSAAPPRSRSGPSKPLIEPGIRSQQGNEQSPGLKTKPLSGK